jgi:hypothetical protein
MYIKYITYSLFIVIRPHVCGSWNITPKNEKMMQYPSIKFPLLSHGSGFFLKKNIIMHLLFQKKKKKKTIFWMKFHPKT